VTNAGLLTTAKSELSAAYNNANSRTPDALVGDLSGQTLGPGIYGDDNSPNSMEISAAGTKTLTLDGGGDPNAIFIFQSDTTLTASAGSVVSLINEAQACNVFWQVGTSATLGTSSNFKGTIMAAVTITDNGGSTVAGRLLADADNTDADSTGAVTLNNTTITVPACAAATSTPAPASASGRREGTINVVKTVINDNGGTKTIADFPLFVNGALVVSGVTNNFDPLGPPYTVTETADPNYTRTFSGDCDVNGQAGLGSGENKFCIITNNDIGKPVVVPPVPPLIDVIKVPSPLALPAGPGSVTYTYSLKNIGTVPVTDITMVGDTCSPIILVSGDTNSDAKLDINETWTYRCSTTLAATHTNTVTTTGWANGISAVDIASATVVVGLPIVPPLIHVAKVPSPLTLLAGGGMVTYTKRVTNPGTVALSNVQVTDDKCSPVHYISGDTNGDSKLDVSENWTYTCQVNLIKTTTNTATASGEANGLTARDLAIATVVVAAPSLPNTGFLPAVKNIPWNIVLPVGLFAVIAILLIVFLRKRAT